MLVAHHRRVTAVALATAVALLAPAASQAGGAACAGADALPGQGSDITMRGATVCLMNAERSARGVAPLRAHPALASVAARYAAERVGERFFAHTSPRGSTVLSRIRSTTYLRGAIAWSLGENLAWGSGTLSTPRAIVAAWMASPGHRANLLSACFRDVGVGIATGAPAQLAADQPASTYVTDFGRRSARPCRDGGARAAH
jgi:uncharacterized protein YkwD